MNPPEKVFYFYAMDQPIFSQIKRDSPVPVEFFKNLPSDEQLEDIITSPLSSKLIVLDDFGLFLNKSIANLASVGSHHGNIHLVILVQNLFTKNKYLRDISLSCTQVTLFYISAFYITSYMVHFYMTGDFGKEPTRPKYRSSLWETDSPRSGE